MKIIFIHGSGPASRDGYSSSLSLAGGGNRRGDGENVGLCLRKAGGRGVRTNSFAVLGGGIEGKKKRHNHLVPTHLSVELFDESIHCETSSITIYGPRGFYMCPLHTKATHYIGASYELTFIKLMNARWSINNVYDHP